MTEGHVAEGVWQRGVWQRVCDRGAWQRGCDRGAWQRGCDRGAWQRGYDRTGRSGVTEGYGVTEGRTVDSALFKSNWGGGGGLPLLLQSS